MIKKTKILVDGHVLDGIPQGTKSYIVGLYNSLSRLENITIIVAVNNLDKAQELLRGPNIKFVKYRFSSKIIKLIFEIPYLSFKFKVDFTHFQYIVSPLIYGKKINTIHDILFVENKDQYPFSFYLSRYFTFYVSSKISDIIITPSNYSRKSISKYFNIPTNKIKLLPLGINSHFKSSNNINRVKDIKPYILYVSRIEKRKNHINLFRAYFDSGIYNTYDILIVGEKIFDDTELDNYLNNLPPELKEKIKFIGSVTNKHLLELFQSTSLFVYPSLNEGFGIPPLEAASLGVPVICSNSTSLEDYGFFNEDHITCSNFEILSERLFSFKKKGTISYNINSVQKKVRKTYDWDNISIDFFNLLINN